MRLSSGITLDSSWTLWKGGQCPVPFGTLVDVVYRDGEFNYGVGARGGEDGSHQSRHAHNWSSMDADGCIVAYRVHKADCVPPVEIPEYPRSGDAQSSPKVDKSTKCVSNGFTLTIKGEEFLFTKEELAILREIIYEAINE